MRNVIVKYKETYSDDKRPTAFIDRNGYEYKVTDENYSKLINYLNDNDISVCSSTVSYYLRKKILWEEIKEEKSNVKRLTR